MSADDAASSPARDFGAEVLALEAMLGEQRDAAVVRLRAVHEAWRARWSASLQAEPRRAGARAVERGSQLLARDAVEQPAQKSGSGRSARGPRARAKARVDGGSAHAAARPSVAVRDGGGGGARALLETVQSDPNGSAARHRKTCGRCRSD